MKTTEEGNTFGLSHSKSLTYMAMTMLLGSTSHARRKKVGALILKLLSGNRWQIVSDGVNGMRPGESNQCEDPNGKTKSLCRHAERNAIVKLHEEPIRLDKPVVLFVTFQPCLDCAGRIDDAGINHVFYCFPYKDTKGLRYLDDCKIGYTQIDFDEVKNQIPANLQDRCHFDASGTLRESGVVEGEAQINSRFK